jgi:undecaprenyl-diphosphatase
MEKIKQLDTELFLYINGGHNAFLDPIMYWASDKFFWIPFYAVILFLLIREYKKRSIPILVSIAILITLCDQIASNVIKNAVKRLRPSHEPLLNGLVHLSKAGAGGKYGFVSSHAANAFGLATFLILILPKKYNPLKWVLVFWALLLSYSRIYNGVHYPADVIVAALIGVFLAFVVAKIYLYRSLKPVPKSNSKI